MIIVCLGYPDKRSILYALIKLLQNFGDAAVVTQNRQLQRLLDGNSSGYFNNTYIAISDAKADEVLREKGFSDGDFDHVIYDSINVLPAVYDICIHCRSYGVSDAEKELLESLPQAIKYNFNYDSRSQGDCINIPFNFPVMKSIEEFEGLKVLAPMQNDVLLKNLAQLTASYLKMDEKEIVKILKKRWNER